MKTKFILPLLGSLVPFLAVPLDAQISESESSVNVLAVQCSVSSGFSSSDFDDYSRRLAKTLALLSPAQQTRVFGYLPQPNGAMSSNKSSPAASTNTAPASAKTAGSAGSSGLPAAEAPAPGALDGLIGMIGQFNEALTGNESAAAAPVYGGVELDAATNVPVVGNQIAAADSGGVVGDSKNRDLSLQASAEAAITSPQPGEPAASGSATPSSWDALLSWFKAAESAYNDGTLKEFLQTQP